ncbi:MAG TPA: pitrilysin family protein, partial [Chthonomonadales bacterium]|nr:pitrilysin family protein [Chthonomonadales bacterium]
MAIDIWVRAGSGQEKESESGTAHFLEHLIFKGTPTRKPGEIDAAIEDLGSLLNAGTTRDGTHFYTTVASRYLETALEVLADALQNATLSEKAIRHERSVILDEIARGRNDIQRQLFDRLHTLLYPNHAYSRPVHGLVESLSILTRDTISAFYRRFYAPNNTTVVLVGDLSPDNALASVTRTFGSWARREVLPPPAIPAEGLNTPRTVIEISPGSEAAIAIGFKINTGERAQEICIADVVAILLSDRIRER